MNTEQVAKEIAFCAFRMHYNETKQPGWSTAEVHWRSNPAAQTLWASIVSQVAAVVRMVDASIAPDTKTLPGLGGKSFPNAKHLGQITIGTIEEPGEIQPGLAIDRKCMDC